MLRVLKMWRMCTNRFKTYHINKLRTWAPLDALHSCNEIHYNTRNLIIHWLMIYFAFLWAISRRTARVASVADVLAAGLARTGPPDQAPGHASRATARDLLKSYWWPSPALDSAVQPSPELHDKHWCYILSTLLGPTRRPSCEQLT